MAIALTTTDNPYSPFDEYDQWLAYDREQGYYSNELLARTTITSEDLADEQQEQDIEDAIDEIVLENVSGMHRKLIQ